MFSEQLLEQILDMAATGDVYWNSILSSPSDSQTQIAVILMADKDTEKRTFPYTISGSIS